VLQTLVRKNKTMIQLSSNMFCAEICSLVMAMDLFLPFFLFYDALANLSYLHGVS